MAKFNSLEKTLFVPMLGRIYATENFPYILTDEKALELKQKIPKRLKRKYMQTQYMLLNSAVCSANIDRYIANFIKRKPKGIIAQLGCGLETAFYRNDDENAVWYEIDYSDVITYRRMLLPESGRDRYFAGDIFQMNWIKEIRSVYVNAPILVTLSNPFYYFKKSTILQLLRNLQNFGEIEVVFDIVSQNGMKYISKYMNQFRDENTPIYFYINHADELAEEVGGQCKVLAEEKYYSHIEKDELNLSTAFSMYVSDLFTMIKMIHIRL